MATNVRARVLLKARVHVVNSTGTSSQGLQTGGPYSGAQWFNIHHCTTKVIDLNEWKWRHDTAMQVLCGGTAPYGTTYAGAIGYYWLAYAGADDDSDV
jgi:hypothetical protein